jgi:predicted DsbA family dithiol-disulfide isomerase
MKQIKVEIWSDVACPWCYIGKRRFEAALAQFEHRDRVEIVWRSFELAPDAPTASEDTVNEMLAKKYGMSMQQAIDANTQITALAAAEGLDYHIDKARYGNSFDAHRLIHLAATYKLQDAMKERLLKAYFTDGLAIADIDTLVQLADEVGIDPTKARTILESDAYASDVRADEQRASEFGISGVPFFAFDEKYGVSGAQPAAAFSEVLARTWAEARPQLISVESTTQDAGVCNDDSCAI